MYRLKLDGYMVGAIQFTLDQVADRIAQAHLDGSKWDVRRVTRGQGYRPLTNEETQELIWVVTQKLS